MDKETNLCYDHKESLLDLNFLQSEKFKPKDREQLKRIEKKLLILYELKNGDTKNIRREAKDIVNFEFEDRKRFSRKLDSISFNKEIKQNVIVGIVSLSSYLYFTRVSKMFYFVNSIALFKPLFLFTFCGAPVMMSLYFSNLNTELQKLTHSNSSLNKS